jgi:hypothetical protein
MERQYIRRRFTFALFGIWTSVSAASAQTTLAADTACAIATRALVRSALGLQVGSGETQPSHMEGSTCDLKRATGIFHTEIVVQLSSKANRYYQPEVTFSNDATHITDIGDRGMMQGPKPRSNNKRYIVNVVKGNMLAYVTIFSTERVPTPEEVKAFMKAIVEQL